MKFQIGKFGLTDNVVESLRSAFKTHDRIRISVLKNAVRDKSKVRDIADELARKLGNKHDYGYRHIIIGFTIILIKNKKSKVYKAYF